MKQEVVNTRFSYIVLGLIIISIFTISKAFGQKYEKYVGMTKGEVLSDLTLNDNVTDLGSGEADDGRFYYSAIFNDATYLGVYFNEEGTCEVVVHFVELREYKSSFKKMKNKAKVDDSITEVDGTSFFNPNTKCWTEFAVESSADARSVYKIVSTPSLLDTFLDEILNMADSLEH